MTTSAAEKKPARTDWHKADIIAALHKRGWSFNQLTYSAGLSGKGTLAQALHRPYPRAEAIIAEAIGVNHPSEIWPSRYGQDGKPNRKPGRKPMNGSSAAQSVARGHRSRNLQAVQGG